EQLEGTVVIELDSRSGAGAAERLQDPLDMPFSVFPAGPGRAGRRPPVGASHRPGMLAGPALTCPKVMVCSRYAQKSPGQGAFRATWDIRGRHGPRAWGGKKGRFAPVPGAPPL